MAIKNNNRAVYFCFVWLLVFTVLLQTSDGHGSKKHPHRRRSRNLVFYFHDVLYDGTNAKNATSTLVGAPHGANLIHLAPKDNHFGDLVVFDDPITLDNNFHSPPVGRAQGLYFYDMKNTFSAWLGFTFVLNSTHSKGTITFAGADPILTKYRDISVVGGTGDFLMARGIATVSTDAFEGEVYFRLRVNITLYEWAWCSWNPYQGVELQGVKAESKMGDKYWIFDAEFALAGAPLHGIHGNLCNGQWAHYSSKVSGLLQEYD